MVKDLIKIENEIDLDLRVLALLDDNLTINIIDNEKIIEKVELKLPESFVGLFKCKNPRCVSVNERDIEPKFDLVDKEKKIYKCSYCDHLLNMED